MGVFEYKDKKVTPLAYYGIGGADFQTGLTSNVSWFAGPCDARGPAAMLGERA